ncbi:Late embryogenesis abundant protein, LEA-5 [Corchorus olitorius]|uniref:Late embryogenesis abundant protein, LEA-5 n=1 Tax=Corchorus olitorius TaxID=93759 RepID=A0A1R3JUH5_9ROSI|nr:Late embryogenesis abundant protein, LEA-5 [Corchorus olitorius]
MARSVSSLKFLAASVSDALSLTISRRGFSAAPQGAMAASFGKGGSRPGLVGKMDQRATVLKEESGVCSAWAPDPVTGYYRPENCAAEIDAAELREMLLNHKVIRPH